MAGVGALRPETEDKRSVNDLIKTEDMTPEQLGGEIRLLTRQARQMVLEYGIQIGYRHGLHERLAVDHIGPPIQPTTGSHEGIDGRMRQERLHHVDRVGTRAVGARQVVRASVTTARRDQALGVEHVLRCERQHPHYELRVV